MRHLPPRRTHHHPCAAGELNAGWVGGHPLHALAELGNHLVQGADLLVRAAGLGVLDQFEHGARVHDREGEGGARRPVAVVKGFEAGLF